MSGSPMIHNRKELNDVMYIMFNNYIQRGMYLSGFIRN